MRAISQETRDETDVEIVCAIGPSVGSGYENPDGLRVISIMLSKFSPTRSDKDRLQAHTNGLIVQW